MESRAARSVELVCMCCFDAFGYVSSASVFVISSLNGMARIALRRFRVAMVTEDLGYRVGCYDWSV